MSVHEKDGLFKSFQDAATEALESYLTGCLVAIMDDHTSDKVTKRKLWLAELQLCETCGIDELQVVPKVLVEHAKKIKTLSGAEKRNADLSERREEKRERLREDLNQREEELDNRSEVCLLPC